MPRGWRSLALNLTTVTNVCAALISNSSHADMSHFNRAVEFLRHISEYAIERYGMHIFVGLHSLPGGVNNLDIGVALFHDG